MSLTIKSSVPARAKAARRRPGAAPAVGYGAGSGVAARGLTPGAGKTFNQAATCYSVRALPLCWHAGLASDSHSAQLGLSNAPPCPGAATGKAQDGILLEGGDRKKRLLQLLFQQLGGLCQKRELVNRQVAT
jgi:hypothetical protein